MDPEHKTTLGLDGWRSRWVCPYGLCEDTGFMEYTKRVFVDTPDERIERFAYDCMCRPGLIAANHAYKGYS
jgi:hypothetical protein